VVACSLKPYEKARMKGSNLEKQKEENNMAKNYVDQKDMEEVGLKGEEAISKKNVKNDKNRMDKDTKRVLL
jgi:hypothetical protein